jgi:glycosyltransferase 2 family protein
MTEPRVLSPSPSASASHRWLVFGIFLALVATGFIVAASDGRALLRVAGDIRGPLLLLPLLCTIGSYTAMAVSYQRIAAAAGLELGFPEMLKITLASTSANYLFSTGGLSGLALRSYFFSQRHGLSSGSAVSISLAQTFLTNFVLLAFLFWGLLNLFLHGELHGSSEAIIALLFVLSLLLCSAAVAIVTSRPMRQRLLAFLMRIPSLFSRVFHTRGESVRGWLELFEAELNEGVDFLIARGTGMVGPMLYIGLDWSLMLATLYTAFYCIQEPVPLHIVVIGFSAGVFLSVINLVPGGLGIMEGSMAAVFAAFGVPLESAVVAAVIFRVSYYILPLAVSLLFFRRMMVAAQVGVSRGRTPAGRPE